MYNPQAPAALTNWQFLAVFMIGTGALKAFYGAWYLQHADPIFTMVATQRKRYFFLSLGTMISFLPMAYLVMEYGWHTFQLGITDWSNIGGPMAVVVPLLIYVGLSSPLWAALCATHIYRKPSIAAKRVRGGFYLTHDVRRKVMTTPTYTDDTIRLEVCRMLYAA